MRARISPVEAMPCPFSPPMPTAKSVLVDFAIWLLELHFAGRSGLRQVQAPPNYPRVNPCGTERLLSQTTSRRFEPRIAHQIRPRTSEVVLAFEATVTGPEIQLHLLGGAASPARQASPES